jgi:hypothetical protein
MATVKSHRHLAVAHADVFPALTLPETKQLAWFLDGSIMDVGVRHHLWRSWGFCERHTWAHAIAEIELRYTALGTAILYDDLLGRARRALARRWEPATLRCRALRARDSCYTCDYVAHAGETPTGDLQHQQRQVNERSRFTDQLLREWPVWAPRACPHCAPGAQGIPCRRHLAAEPARLDHEVVGGLTELGDRLSVYLRSLTWRGPEAQATHRSAFVEVLGWFAGWQIPLALARPEEGSVET